MNNLDFARDVVRAIHSLENVSNGLCDWCDEANKRDEDRLKAFCTEEGYWYHDVSQNQVMDCDAGDIRGIISDLEMAVSIAGYSFLFENIWATTAGPEKEG